MKTTQMLVSSASLKTSAPRLRVGSGFETLHVRASQGAKVVIGTQHWVRAGAGTKISGLAVAGPSLFDT